MTQTLTQKSMLARLLAKENIEVVQGNFPTAYFDVENRVLGLPHFKDVSKDLYDLLVGHEVGHALYTPADGWHDSEKEVPGVPRSFINIIEDIRIEKKILAEYPGLLGGFKRGYQELLDRDFFGIENEDVNEMSFMDRLNIFSKSRGLVDVSFTEEEQPFVDMAMGVTKWEDVLSTCKALCEWLGVEAPAQDEQETEMVEIEIPMSAMPGDIDQEEQEGEESSSQEESTDEREEDTQESSSSMGDGEEGESSETPAGSDAENSEEEAEEAKPEPVKTAGGEEGGKINEQVKMPKDPAAVKTDEAFRANEKTLVNDAMAEDGELFVKGLTREQFEMSKISFAKQKAARNEYIERGYRGADFPQDKFDEWMKESKAQVNLLVKEFEMRKAAYRTLRARTSTKGSLDVTKLHKYKYDDQLFKQVTHLADAKSHGMIMLIDFSGSMARVIESVLRQTLILSQFCQRVGIPYEVYGFTNSSGKTFEAQRQWSRDNNFHTHVETDMQITELLTSAMSKQDKQEAVKFLFNVWRHMYYQSTEFDNMRGTPLNLSYMGLHYIAEDFQKKYNVQKLNVTILTDGYSDRLDLVQGKDVTKDGDRWSEVVHNKKREGKITVDFRGKQMKMELRHYDYGTSDKGPQQVLLKNLKKEFNCSLVHYFVADGASEFRRQVMNVTGYTDMQKAVTAARKAGAFVADDNCGFDRRLILEARGDVLRFRKDGEDELEVDDSMTAAQIASAFKKQSGGKNKKRFISQKFAEMVA